ncbi:MAG: DUF2235 domain-containing protein [Prevotella sp.]|nr:DUF2235 domain-containing protein [Prevotella sp.]
MAITCEVDAKALLKEDKTETDNIPLDIYFGVFFDGTNNNMIPANTARDIRRKYSKTDKNQYESEVLSSSAAEMVKNNANRENTKYSNVAILHSYYKGFTEKDNDDKKDGKRLVYKIYVEGAGANDISDIFTGIPGVGLGFGLGKTGVVALVSKAVKTVRTILSAYNDEDKGNITLHFDVFGFSRGATCSRLFSYLVARETGEEVTNSYDERLPNNREAEFGSYYAKQYYDKKEEKLQFLESDKKGKEWKKITVDFLGIYDTVASIGFLRRKETDNDGETKDKVNKLSKVFVKNEEFKDNYHDQNVREYGLYSPQLTATVKNTFHICALDEFRENFALTDLGKEIPSNGIELLLPGCHSDIGGGYIKGETSVFKIKDIGNLSYYKGNPCNSAEGNPDKLTSQLLKNLGWMMEDTAVVQEGDTLIIKREVPYIFSNIPLRLMIDRVEEKLEDQRGKVFELPDGVYAVGSESNKFNIEEFYQGLKSIIPSYEGKRLCVLPNSAGENNLVNISASYKELRREYLHFTSNDTLGWSLANAANKADNNMNVLCRIVYHGDKDDGEMHYMSDYGLDSQESESPLIVLIGKETD